MGCFAERIGLARSKGFEIAHRTMEGALLGSILIVDDDNDNGQLLSEYLGRLGYNVSAVLDGTQAIEHLKKGSFDLVITDVNMPGLSGLDLLESIKEAGLSEDVLMLSGTSSIPTAVQAMRLGAVTFLEKPLDLELLKSEVRAVIRKRRERMGEPSPPTPHTSEVSPRPALERAPSMSLPFTDPVEMADATFIRSPTPLPSPAVASSGGPQSGEPQSGEPQTIGRYLIEGVLGRGGMGVVYRCSDPALGRPVALKVLRNDIATALDRKLMTERFAREALAAGRLKHPNIVTVYDFGEVAETNALFLAMELANGVSLESIITSSGRLPWQRVVKIAYQVADALAHAHRAGIVHRDVKHANIIVGDDDFVHLLDFGVARLVSSNLTQPGMIAGSPGYLAPETFGDVEVDYRADQFALGTVMLEALTGTRYFSGGDFATLVRKLTITPTPSLATMGIRVPVALEGILQRLHQKDRDQRYNDEQELLADLAAVAREAGITLTAPSI